VLGGTEETTSGRMRLEPRSGTLDVPVLVINDSPITVELPNFIELQIAKTDPGIRGDTASGGSKPATLETGAVVQVPLFLNEGDVVKVDTRSGEYLGRVATAG